MDVYQYIKAFLDIGIVTLLFYKIVMIIKDNSKATEIMKGLIFILALWGISYLFDLTATKYVISQALLYGVLGLMILFQPELRTALEKLGKNNFSSKQNNFSSKQKLINDLVEASIYLSDRKIGALISIEMQDSLQEYMDTGIELDAKVSSQLLQNIFTPNVPLHDGALFIRGNRIIAASGYLPLTDRDDIPKELGTRHRASIGLSEQTDAMTLVVSEETGTISLVHNGELLRPLDKDTLRNHLEIRLITTEDKTKLKSKKQKKNNL